MKFRMEIRCGNAAFEPVAGAEIARILRQLARKLDDMEVAEAPLGASLRDVNGNTVGDWSFSDSP